MFGLVDFLEYMKEDSVDRGYIPSVQVEKIFMNCILYGMIRG